MPQFISLLVLLAFVPLATNAQEAEGKVVEVTDDNFDELMESGPWMIEVYAPWCSHCRQLEPQWNLLAQELAPKGIQVGKINGPECRVLMKRLGVSAFPSIFFLKEGSTWAYEGARTVAAFKDFATGGHEKEAALPFWSAPNSILGKVLGQRHRIPLLVKEAYTFLRTTKGLSDLTIVGGFLAVPVVVGAITICMVDALYLRQARMAVDLGHEHAE